MSRPIRPVIVSIDDDQDFLNLIQRLLGNKEYQVITADNGQDGLKIIKEKKPNLILLDIQMKDIDGYQICTQLQADEETALIPVIFVTVLEDEQDKAKAFAVGAVDYLVKPLQKEALLQKVRKHVVTDMRWKSQPKKPIPWHKRIQPGDFIKFKEFIFSQLKLKPEDKYQYAKTPPANIYTLAAEMGVSENKMAQYIAEYLQLPYLSTINPENVQLGVLPTLFCKSNHVVAVTDTSGEKAFIITNPFDWDRLDNLNRFAGLDEKTKLIISEPNNIDLLLKYDPALEKKAAVIEDIEAVEEHVIEKTGDIPESEIEKSPIVYVANIILEKAVTENASDIHILPKQDNTVVRFRIDGDLKEFYVLERSTGIKLISRVMVLADIDIAEKKKPQDGGFAAVVNNRTFNFRVSSTYTPYGESLIIRLLEPYAKPRALEELGMADQQVRIMLSIANQTGGLVLIVGPTGSGKTTTIYSLLHNMDCVSRSLISVEDPVEYRIPFANQQQVNEKIGVTFEALLRSVVRQDPDILFMGEIRDQYTARMAIDFSSTGHLTISSLHTSNATTAVFRLERLGVDRRVMADTVLAVVAQRLLKKLCPHCKKIARISDQELELIAPFTDDPPTEVAHPIGCLKCNDSGYFGREGVYEILTFDAQISEMVRSGLSITEIRSFVQERGDYLKSRHAIEKVKQFILSPMDVYEKVLVEDVKIEKAKPKTVDAEIEIETPSEEETTTPSILIAEDDDDTRKLLGRILENRGYQVTMTGDGIEVLLELGKSDYDLVLADVNMPNLDGFRLLEMMNQKGIQAPVIFLTARDSLEDERKGLELGAMDYIKKPIQKEILALRVKSALEKIKGGLTA